MNKTSQGQISVTLLFFAGLTVVLVSGFVFLASSFLQLSVRSLNKVRAFSTAEAGIEYYRWHLAHAPQDFKDGTGNPGPYVHNYYDKDGTLIGNFSLTVTPPPAGSTVVTIRSSGSSAADPSITKVIEVKMAIPSLAKYAVAINSDVRFGSNTEVFGEIMSNGGIRFDGLAHNLVKSAKPSYNDTDHSGADEFGVHTHRGSVDPLPPAPVPARPDVFMAGREFPVPAVDFAGITQNLADIKTKSQNGGYYATSSGAFGYDLVFSTSSAMTTFGLYKVTALTSPPSGCTNASNQDGWGTWSIQSETLVATGTIPLNGIFFIEDNLWVRGGVQNARITVASAKFPDDLSTRTSITVNQDVRYTNYNGSDVISLIAQKNFNVGLFSNDILRIDAALVAQNGRAGRYYYIPPNDNANSNKCGPTVVRQKITLYGMIGSNQRYGFGYTDSTGYIERVLIYDTNLLYAPPPSFPLTTDQYAIVSWNEIQ